MAVSAFAHIRKRIREEITRDLDGDYWDDDLLDGFIDEGQLQYCRRSRSFRKQAPILLRGDVEAYHAPEDCYEITRIETADGKLIEPISTTELQDIVGEGTSRDSRSNWMSTRGGVNWREQTGDPQYWYQDLDGRQHFRFYPRPSPTIDTAPAEFSGLQEALIGDYVHPLEDSERTKLGQLGFKKIISVQTAIEGSGTAASIVVLKGAASYFIPFWTGGINLIVAVGGVEVLTVYFHEGTTYTAEPVLSGTTHYLGCDTHPDDLEFFTALSYLINQLANVTTSSVSATGFTITADVMADLTYDIAFTGTAVSFGRFTTTVTTGDAVDEWITVDTETVGYYSDHVAKTGIDLRYNPIMKSVGDLLYIYTSSQLFVYDSEMRELWSYASGDKSINNGGNSGEVSASGIDVFDGYSEESEKFGRAYLIYSAVQAEDVSFASGDSSIYGAGDTFRTGGSNIRQVSPPDYHSTEYPTVPIAESFPVQPWHESTPLGTCTSYRWDIATPVESGATGPQAYINADNTFNINDFPDNGSFSFSLWCLPTGVAINNISTGEGSEYDLLSSLSGSYKGMLLRFTPSSPSFNWMMAKSDGGVTSVSSTALFQDGVLASNVITRGSDVEGPASDGLVFVVAVGGVTVLTVTNGSTTGTAYTATPVLSGATHTMGCNLDGSLPSDSAYFTALSYLINQLANVTTSSLIATGFTIKADVQADSTWDIAITGNAVTLNRIATTATAGNYVDPKWVHIAGRYDSSAEKLSIWVDNNKTEAASTGTGFTSSELFRIGGGRAGYPWLGHIDEVMAFNVALTDDEVTALYNDGNGVYGSPAHRGVKGIFHLDEGTGTNGTTIADTANNNDATLYIKTGVSGWGDWDTTDAKIEPPDILDPGYDRLVVSRSGRFLVTGKSGLGATPLGGGNIRARFTDGTKLEIEGDGTYSWKGFLADTSKKFYQGVASGDSVYVVMGADGGGYVKEATTGELAFVSTTEDETTGPLQNSFTVQVANGTVNGNDSFAHGLTWTAFQAAQDMYGICRVSDDLLYINVNGTLSTYVPSTDTLTATAITTLLATTPLHYASNKIWALNTASDLIRIDIVTPDIEHTYAWPIWAKKDSGDSLNFDLVGANHGDRTSLDLVNKFAVLDGKPLFLLPDASASTRQAFILYAFDEGGGVVNINDQRFGSDAGAIVGIKDDSSPVSYNQEEGLVASIEDSDTDRSALMFYIADPEPGLLQVDDTDALVAYAASRCYEVDDEQQDIQRTALFRSRFEERLSEERKGSVVNYTTSRKRTTKGSFF